MNTPLKFDHRTVALDEIESEKAPFRITTDSTVGDLSDALKQVGLISPPVLTCQEDSCVIVCGHRRVKAARALGWETIPSRILLSGNDPLTCACLAISENSIERPLNLIETSRALSLLKTYLPDDRERYNACKKLGLPFSPSHIKKIEPLCALPQQIQNGILTGEIALPTALMLSALQPKTAGLLSELLRNLKLSLNKQKELIVIIQEISLIEDLVIEDLILSEEVQGILNDPEMDLPRKSGLVRGCLKRRRYPHISHAMDAFEKLKSSLSLGENVSLKAPPGFEGNAYNIAFSFSNMAELNRHKQTLERLSRDERIGLLLDSEYNKKNS